MTNHSDAIRSPSAVPSSSNPYHNKCLCQNLRDVAKKERAFTPMYKQQQAMRYLQKNQQHGPNNGRDAPLGGEMERDTVRGGLCREEAR